MSQDFGISRLIKLLRGQSFSFAEQESQNFYSVGSVAVEKIIAHGIHKTITMGQPLDVSDENGVTQFGNQTDGKPNSNNGNKPFVDNKLAYYLSTVNHSFAHTINIVKSNVSRLMSISLLV